MTALKNIYFLTLKELRVLLGDRVLVGLIIFMFTAMLFSSAENSTGVRNAPVGYIDRDQSTLSRQIIAGLLSPYFRPPEPVEPAAAEVAMDKGDYVFILEFPPHFERDVLAGRRPAVQLLIDATAMTQAGVGAGYIEQIFTAELLKFLQLPKQEDFAPFRPVLRLHYNQNYEDRYFLPVMDIITVSLVMGFLLVGSAVIREREHGTIEHLLVMPLTAREIMLAKILANSLVVLTAAMLSLWFVVHLAIGAPIYADTLPLYAVGMASFLFALASLAIMLATIAPTMQQFGLLMLPLFMVLLLFSGSQTPRHGMPPWVQWLSEYWPTTQFAYFSKKVLFRRAELALVWPELAVLTGTGLLFLRLALSRFRRMLEQQG